MLHSAVVKHLSTVAGPVELWPGALQGRRLGQDYPHPALQIDLALEGVFSHGAHRAKITELAL